MYFSKLAAVRLRLGTVCALASLSLLSLTAPVASAGTTPTISGTAPRTGVTGQAYSFTPSATGPGGSALRFSILDMPSWGTFNSATGRLSGTPTVPGTYSNIMIGVSDGGASARLSPFTITVSRGTGSTSSSGSSAALAISGTPPTSANVASAYSFTPAAQAPSGQALRFTIYDMPSWAAFNSSTGQLSGTPKVSGNYSNIVIGVTNGVSKATLPPFTITVNSSGAPLATGGVTISWTPPTENTNGSALTNLSGYHIYYGTNQSNLNNVVNITNTGLASYVVSNLSAATWYFALTSVNSSGVESPRTAVMSHVVQ